MQYVLVLHENLRGTSLQAVKAMLIPTLNQSRIHPVACFTPEWIVFGARQEVDIVPEELVAEPALLVQVSDARAAVGELAHLPRPMDDGVPLCEEARQVGRVSANQHEYAEQERESQQPGRPSYPLIILAPQACCRRMVQHPGQILELVFRTARCPSFVALDGPQPIDGHHEYGCGDQYNCNRHPHISPEGLKDTPASDRLGRDFDQA
mmetsp:Transcript_12073/g.25512  ORF Transcript_12073/g.25512 Transcript_12073/m.25512 type:complete len:208 (+) Transcript_12073:471-1094(+)